MRERTFKLHQKGSCRFQFSQWMNYTEAMNNQKKDRLPVIFDSHVHLFPPSVIASVSKRNGLAEALCLDVESAAGRTDKAALKREIRSAGVSGCLLLPTAPVSAVRRINNLFLETVSGEDELLTAGTLHPSFPNLVDEMDRLSLHNVRALKFYSFSQGIDLEAEETFRLFEKIRRHNLSGKPPFFAIFDTFYQAERYFGASGKHITTPEKLRRLVTTFPEIYFVAAHMGGLAAPYREIEEQLHPQSNLYLETSNAAHVLSREEFVRLLERHGPEHVIFGTDWPWFGHLEEIALIQGLLQEAGFSAEQQALVFSGNISRILAK
jgi:predicted TIM-barrel fold metal-dependent hydrolase